MAEPISSKPKRTWTKEDAAYNPEYDSRFKNVDFRKLDNNLIYDVYELDSINNDALKYNDLWRWSYENNKSPQYEAAIRRRAPFKKINEQAITNLENSLYKCLGSTLNWQSNKAGMFGVTPIRAAIKDFSPTTYKGGQYIIPDYDRFTGEETYGKGLNSWNFPQTLDDAGYGTIIDLSNDSIVDYSKFPLFTVFSQGDASGKYIPRRFKTDKNGNKYPQHSYILTGYARDDRSGNIMPLLNDYGNITNEPVIHPGENPTYAFIPKGYEHLTIPNIEHHRQLYKDAIYNTDKSLYSLPNEEEANKRFIESIDPNELTEINRRYGITNAPMVMQRLMSIGAQESELGYTLSQGDYGGIDSWWSNFKWSAPDAIKTAKKNWDRGTTPTRNLEQEQIKINSQYDTQPAWRHEIDLFNKMLTNGDFKGKSKEEIQAIMNEALKQVKAQSNLGDNWGKLPPNLSTLTEDNKNNSHGIFQMKTLPSSTRTLSDGTTETFNIDDLYKGNNDVMKAYNRLGYIMQSLKEAYPDLSEEELLDAATVTWNAPSKTTSQDFINFYIKDQNLQDDYLSKVRNHQKRLYGDRYQGRYKLGGSIKQRFKK